MEQSPRKRTFSMPHQWPAPAQYALALLLVGASLLLRWMLDPVLQDRVPVFLTLGVLLPVVLLVRPGPFFAAAVLGGAGAMYLFIPPRASFTLGEGPEVTTIVIFFVMLALGVATAWLSQRAWDARERDRQALTESERGLRARAQQFEMLLEKAPIGVYLVDAALRIVEVNPGAESAFGRPAEEIVGRSLEEILHEHWEAPLANEVAGIFRRTLETGESFVAPEKIGQRVDRGVTEYYDWRTDRIVLPDGKFGVVCYFREISAQVLSRQAIAQSEKRYRALFNSIDQGFCLLEVLFDAAGKPIDFRYLETNPTFARHTGLENSEGKRIRELYPNIEQRWVDTYGEVVTSGLSARFEDESVAMGKWFAVDAFRVGDPEDRRVGVLVADITARKHAEKSLRERERHMQLITDATPALISYVDSELRYQFNNKSYEQWFDRPREDIKGRYMHEVLGERAFAAIRPHVESALAGNTVEYEALIPYRDSGNRYIHAHYVPEFLPDGTVSGFFVLVHDMTSTKQAEEALREAHQRKDEFLATLAHELRNPLGAIRMALGVIEHGTDPGRTNEMSAIIDRQSAQLARLVEDLLDVSRISRGTIELRKGRVDVGEVVRHVVEDVGPLCEANLLKISLALPDSPIKAEADAARLAQVVSNLVHNACKFTEQGGEIGVIVERAEGQAVVRVRDTGIGLSREQLNHIFEMFAQGEMARSRAGGGLGIGLSLARSIIELHGGTLDACSDGPGQGSEFVVRLPAPESESQGRPAGEHAGGGARRPTTPPRRILAADDNEDALGAVATMLRMGGHQVETAADGAEALRKAGDWRPDVVLLDIGMPRLDGYEVARRIRGEQWGQDILLIAMTGWGQARDKAQASHAGFDAHMTKPIDPELLGRLLELRVPAAEAAELAPGHE
jgi:PAS domain S-box-containing protein